MSVFDLDTKGQEALAEEARLHPVSIDDVHVSAFTGLGRGIGSGIMRGGARAGQFLGMTGGALLQMAGPPVEPVSDAGLDAYGPDADLARERVSDAYFSKVDEYANNAVDHWTPAHAEVGKAGQVLGGFGEIVLPLMASGGNPALLIGSQEMGQATDLAREGVDAGTAVRSGVIQGAASAAGFKLPFLGSSLASKIATGAAGNAAVGAWTAATQRAWLESDGYKQLAEQYDPLDVEARAVDLLSGAAFGGIDHVMSGDRDAIAVANNAKHFQRDTAPGKPADIAASVAHQDALETAIEQTLRGEPVSVPAEVTQAEFTPRERDATAQARVQAFEDHAGAALEEQPAPSVPDAVRQALGPHYEEATRVKPGFDAAVREIAAEAGTPHEPRLPRLKGIERAAAKVAADYGGDVTRLKDVVRGTIVVDSLEQAEKALAAAGKRSELIGVRNHLQDDSPPVTQDGYRDIKFNVALGKQLGEIQINLPEMIAAKKQAHVFYEKWQALDRKAALEGRDFTPAEAAQARDFRERQRSIYAAAWESVLRTRSRKAGSESSVPLWAKEEDGNRRPPGTSQARQTKSGVQEQGTPSTSAKSVPGGNEAGSDIASTSSGSIAEEGPGRTAPLDLDIKAAEDLLATSDFQVPTGELDADGSPVTRSARELLDEADAEIAKAQNDAKGIEAAVTCFLSRGNDAS